MKKHIKAVAGVLAIVVAFSGGVIAERENISLTAPITAGADDKYTMGTYEKLTYKNYGDYIEISDCDESAMEVIIPKEIDGVPVTYIGGSAFKNCISLTSVTIPESVTRIGAYAFESCNALASLTILNPNCTIYTPLISKGNVIISGGNAETVIYGYKNSTAQAYAKEYWHTFVTLDEVTTMTTTTSTTTSTTTTTSATTTSTTTTTTTAPIETYNKYGAFYYVIEEYGEITIIYFDKSTKNVIIPSEIDGIPVTAIGQSAFADCSDITSVTIPDSVKIIGVSAFESCSKLKSVTIPNSIEYIWDYAFCNCIVLQSVTIPDSVKYIGDSAFCNCICLTSITIPKSVTTISDYAFWNCSKLRSVTILNPKCDIYYYYYTLGDKSITTIYGYENSTAQAYAKKYEYNFSSLDTSETASTGKYGAFEYEIKNGEVTIKGFDKSITDIVIPSEIEGLPVTSISSIAFKDCRLITSVIIPESVASIGYRAFYGCDNLTSVTVLNPKCEIDNSSYTLGDASITTIYGYRDSTAQEYARIYNKYNFLSLEAMSTTTTTLTTTTTNTTTTTTATSLQKGDINGDGRVDAIDASIISGYYAYLSTTKDNPVMDIDEFQAMQK